MKKLHALISLLVLSALPGTSFADGVLGVCEENRILGDACFKFTKVDTLFNSPQILDKEDAVIFFGCGLIMWVLGLKIGALISAIKKAR